MNYLSKEEKQMINRQKQTNEVLYDLRNTVKKMEKMKVHEF